MKESTKKILKNLFKAILTIFVILTSIYGVLLLEIVSAMNGSVPWVRILWYLFFPGIILSAMYAKNKKKIFKFWGIYFLITILLSGIYLGIEIYDRNITVNTAPNIDTDEYLPFDENSKIVTLNKKASLKLENNLPIIDGAAAVFPVYSAFVNAVYPENTKLSQNYKTNFEGKFSEPFRYSNTVAGYKYLGEKSIDIFFGAYPSKSQIENATENNTTFEYTQIGTEAFVFFVHKNNPVTNLTTEQIKGIYSGKITNWKEVGGKDEKIVAYQRNEGSGSQSMLKRFMGDTPIMDAPSELVNDFMSGIIEKVSDYRSTTASIGFSFRYYVEGIIKNPDIKMISIDGVEPTVENIKNEKYPITTGLFAVTYEGNENENVQRLLDWVLSEEGQEIIEKTGYVGIK